MKLDIVSTKKLEGKITAPPSKSVSQRALACALLADGVCKIVNFGFSDDENAALNILKESGCTIVIDGTTLTISPPSVFLKHYNIQCGESGLSSRLFIPIFMALDAHTKINGQGTLLLRPMTIFKSIFEQLQIEYCWNHEKLPLEFKGKQVEKKLTIDGSLSSQFISGMIFYVLLSSKLNDGYINIINPTSIPYIELTIDVLKSFGVLVQFNNNKIEIPKLQKIKTSNFVIEGDWSSASFWLVGAAIWGEVEVLGLNLDSKQADKEVLNALEMHGAKIEKLRNSIKITKSENKSFIFDATNCPDLFPILTVLACFSDGKSIIKGVHRLIHKESNRAEALVHELKKLGVEICIENDTIVVSSKLKISTLKANKVKICLNTYQDHRLVMAFSILALNLIDLVSVQQPSSVKKSYPRFFEDLNVLIK